MKIQFEPPPIYFMHLTKTGGTTIGTRLTAFTILRKPIEQSVLSYEHQRHMISKRQVHASAKDIEQLLPHTFRRAFSKAS